jgi:hypothetical protein
MLKIKQDGYVNGWCIWLVDGNIVKRKYYQDFTEGGNFMAYQWIPYGCIYIDFWLNESQRDYIILHEAVETWLMLNKGMRYDQAHEIANRYEMEARDRGFIE